MDIIIKSFNRPYYLDRCISSIYQFVQGNITIKVLDDGTPEKYLNKIQEKYPEVLIFRSANYEEKGKAIRENLLNGVEINGFKIPTDLWVDTVTSSSDYLIVTEDDVWFTKQINIEQLTQIMQTNSIALLKLAWSGNHSFNQNFKMEPLTPEVVSVQPNLFTAPYFFMKMFFFNKYKFHSLLYKLGIVDNYTIGKYWVLNSILMGMYKKEYWLGIWKNFDGRVNEIAQLLNASVYYRKHKKNKNFISQLNEEVMKTTFSSSSTNSYHSYDNNFDVNIFNYIMNERWYDDRFDSLQNFPKDFSTDYISSILDEVHDERATSSEWKNWTEKVKAQYRNQGSSVDDD